MKNHNNKNNYNNYNFNPMKVRYHNQPDFHPNFYPPQIHREYESHPYPYQFFNNPQQPQRFDDMYPHNFRNERDYMRDMHFHHQHQHGPNRDRHHRDHHQRDNNNKNTYEYLCIPVKYYGELMHWIRSKNIEFNVSTDIKSEIKVNNQSDNQNKKFFISVPNEELDDRDRDDDHISKKKENALKRKRDREEKKKNKESPAEQKDINGPNSLPNQNQPSQLEHSNHNGPFQDSNGQNMNNQSGLSDSPPKESDIEKSTNKAKLISLDEAKKRVNGYERKFCYIIGFPVDLDTKELTDEIVKLGCEYPVNVEYIQQDPKVKTKNVIECEFTSDEEVDILLKKDLMVKRRNLMVLPKLKEKSVLEIIAYHQVVIDLMFPNDFHASQVRPINIFNAFLRYGPIVSLNMPTNPKDRIVVTYVKKSSAENVTSSRDYKGNPGTVKIDVNSGYTFMRVEYVKMITKYGFQIPVKRFFKAEDSLQIESNDPELRGQIMRAIQHKFDSTRIEDDEDSLIVKTSTKGVSKDVVKYIKNQEYADRVKISYKAKEEE